MYVDLLIQAFGGDDLDVGSPKGNHASAESSNLGVPQPIRDPNVEVMESGTKQKKENGTSISETETPSASPAGESYRSMGEILSVMDPGHPLQVSGVESGSVKAVAKVTGSNHNAKRSAFWGRSNVS